MKILNIQASNVLGARAIDVRLNKPVALFAGSNGAGKSSLQEAVRMALTGETVRVDLKKDYGALVTDGQESGFVEVFGIDEGQEWTASMILPSGKGQHATDATLPFVLDAQRFARMDDKERRTFLYGLMGVKMDFGSIISRMVDGGCDAKKVEQIGPFLRAGFDAAQKEAASKARDAKASWKTATGGETWGKDKAAKWQPEALPNESEKAGARYENAVAKRNEIDAELAKAQQELGGIKAERKRREGAETRRLELHDQASKVERIQTKLNLDTAELAAWEEKVAATRAKAGGKPNPKAPGEFLLRGLAGVVHDMLGLDFDYPEEICNRAAIHLGEFRKLHGEPIEETTKADPEAANKLPEYENALALLQRSVANGKRDLEAAKQAKADYDRLVEEQSQPLPDVSEAEAKVAELTEKRNGWQADADKYHAIADKHARRQVLIEQVAKLHADVMEWTEIADALSPDGIPGQLLAEVLGPINERLHVSAGFAEWEQVAIHSDMRITYGLRDYALISESEKWRADAMIAEAVSFLSGCKLLVLDRFDVLDLKGREDLLYWLDGMATDGEIDTALIFGTLKALPALNFTNIEAHWIDNGAAGQLKEAA